jgi:hypothetical protein
MAQWRVWRPMVMQLRVRMRAAAEKAIGQLRRLLQQLRARGAAGQQ